MQNKIFIKVLFFIGLIGITGCNESTIQLSQINKLQKPVLTSPIISVDGEKTSVTFSWSGNAEHYDFIVRNPGATSASYIKSPIKSNNLTVPFTPNEKPYTWWVKAYESEDPLGNTVDSDFGQFTVNQESKLTTTKTSLLPVELISPAPVITDSPKNVIFTFAWTGNGKKYDIMIKKPDDKDFNAIVSNLTSTSYDMDMSASKLGIYNWKIRSYDENGNYIDSAVRNFTFGK